MTENDISFGVHAVQALLESHPDQIMEIWFQKGLRSTRLEKLIEEARTAGIPVKFVDRNRIERKVEGVHQGVVALVRAATVYRKMTCSPCWTNWINHRSCLFSTALPTLTTWAPACVPPMLPVCRP